MSEFKGWHLTQPGHQPAGPYTYEHILERWQRGEITDATLAWHKGAPDWLPLRDIEIFARAFQEIRQARRKRQLLVTAVVVGAVVAIAALTALYRAVVGPPEIRAAKRWLAAGEYVKAGHALNPYLQRHPRDAQALYLLGLAAVCDFAARTDRTESTQIQTASDLFRDAFTQDRGWQNSAKQEMARIVTTVPATAPDFAGRLLAIQRLRHQHELAEPRQLARELYERITGPSAGASAAGPPDAVWDQIAEWGPALAPQVAQRYLETARERRHTDQTGARHALDRALQLDPVLGENAEAKGLRILTAPAENGERLALCRDFLEAGPPGALRAELLLTIVRDAADLFAGGRSARTRAYLETGLAAARDLLKNHPATPRADESVIALASCFAQWGAGGKDEPGRQTLRQGWELTVALLAALPNSPFKPQAMRVQQEFLSSLTVIGDGLPDTAAGVVHAIPPDCHGIGEGGQRFTFSYIKGTRVTLDARAQAEGLEFSGWYDPAGTRQLSPSTRLEVVTVTDRTLRAKYAPPPPRILTVNGTLLKPASSAYAITVAPADFEGRESGSPPFKLSYTNGATVRLTAPESAGHWTFLGWSGECEAAGNAARVAVDADKSVYATYTPWIGRWYTAEQGLFTITLHDGRLAGSFGSGDTVLTNIQPGETTFRADWATGGRVLGWVRWYLEADGQSFRGGFKKATDPSWSTYLQGGQRKE